MLFILFGLLVTFSLSLTHDVSVVLSVNRATFVLAKTASQTFCTPIKFGSRYIYPVGLGCTHNISTSKFRHNTVNTCDSGAVGVIANTIGWATSIAGATNPLGMVGLLASVVGQTQSSDSCNSETIYQLEFDSNAPITEVCLFTYQTNWVRSISVSSGTGQSYYQYFQCRSHSCGAVPQNYRDWSFNSQHGIPSCMKLSSEAPSGYVYSPDLSHRLPTLGGLLEKQELQKQAKEDKGTDLNILSKSTKLRNIKKKVARADDQEAKKEEHETEVQQLLELLKKLNTESR